MRKNKKKLYLAVGLLSGFVLWTMAVCLFDIQPIGPQGSSVGFAELNWYVHNLLGVCLELYTITDWLGLVPIGVCLGFGALGLSQWINRKDLLKVDRSLLVLGGFYIATMTAYVFFEIIVINYRPVLINGVLEASYPSSTTMLVMCVMPTAAMQLNSRIQNRGSRVGVSALLWAFAGFMVVGRLFSGVHWVTDIIGGMLLSAGLVMLYSSVSGMCERAGSAYGEALEWI